MPNALRPLGRLMTGAVYAVLGWDAIRAPGARVAQAGPTLATIREVVPLPADDTLVVRANAAVQVAGGVALATGVAPRLAAVALIGSMVPTSVAGHGFWTIEDPVARKMQRVQLLKNVAMVGGLVLALADRD